MTKQEMREEIIQLAEKATEITITDRLIKQFNDFERVIIYGAGNCGAICSKHIKKLYGKDTDFFLDRNADSKPEYMNRPVYKSDDARFTQEFKANSFVVIAVLFPHLDDYMALKTQLEQQGWQNICCYYYYYYYGPMFCYDDDESNDRINFTKEAGKIVKAFDLMEDEHSREVYYNIFKSLALIDFDIPALSEGMTEYVDINVPFKNNYQCFVDCGAYMGDTLETLVKFHKISQYFGFEPDMGSYQKLVETAEKLPSIKLVCLPCGVSDKNAFLRFSAKGSGDSKIDESGDTLIQTVRLDDVLRGYNNLIIKMDIEGAEIAALNGAKEIITTTIPDLAICVYHRLTDLWRIPLMLKKLVPEYKFYMRSHHISALDTVVYATIERR